MKELILFTIVAVAFAANAESGLAKAANTTAGLAAAAPTPTIKAVKGQHFIICERTDGSSNVATALLALDERLVKGSDQLTTLINSSNYEIDAPYDVSAVSMTSYDRVGSNDNACVTVTKQ